MRSIEITATAENALPGLMNTSLTVSIPDPDEIPRRPVGSTALPLQPARRREILGTVPQRIFQESCTIQTNLFHCVHMTYAHSTFPASTVSLLYRLRCF